MSPARVPPSGAPDEPGSHTPACSTREGQAGEQSHGVGEEATTPAGSPLPKDSRHEFLMTAWRVLQKHRRARPPGATWVSLGEAVALAAIKIAHKGGRRAEPHHSRFHQNQ